jgi:hypothetical protein
MEMAGGEALSGGGSPINVRCCLLGMSTTKAYVPTEHYHNQSINAYTYILLEWAIVPILGVQA